MKKILFLAILISQITFVFGQDNYGSWVSSKCYNYIQTKMKYNGKSSVQRGNQRIEQGWYTISFKNNSSKKIELWCIASSTSKSASKSDNPIDRVTLNPNETYSNDYYFDNYQQNLLYIEIWRVTVINTDGSANKYYEKCSDGTPCTECIIRPIQTPCGNNSGSNSNSSTSSATNSTYFNNQITTPNNSSNSSSAQTNKTQPNQVINTQPNNTNTELLNLIGSTTTLITNSLANRNSSHPLDEVLKENELKIKTVQEEFAVNNLSDKEIDSLLANPNPNNYATINVYNKNQIDYYLIINGRKLPSVNIKNDKLEYRIYDGTKLVIQAYRNSSFPIQSISTKIRKGKEYYFIVKKLKLYQLTLEQIDEEPLDKKEDKKYENTNQKIKSDIDY